jgi:hypothetical protein
VRAGAYCARCGERFLTPADLDVRAFLLKHLWHEVFEIDGKLWRTLSLLVRRPGALALQFVQGRRQPYLSPLRLYLLLFVIQATITSMLIGYGQTLPQRISAIDVTGILHRLLRYRSNVPWEALGLRVRLTERSHWLSELATALIFLGVAAVLAGLFQRLRRGFVEHLALALNVTSFFLFMFICGEIAIDLAARPRAAALNLDWQQLVSMSALPLYWWLAIRRFYGVRPLPAAGAAALMTASHALIATLLNTLLLALLILSA